MESTGRILRNRDPKVKVKSVKTGICDGVQSFLKNNVKPDAFNDFESR